MDIAFVGERDKFIVIYLDYLIVFSKSDAEHLVHLKQTFEKCHKFGLSLNPKKSHFAMQEGKLLGHIVFRDGIKIDPKRIEAIDTINIPRNRKEINHFWVNFISISRYYMAQEFTFLHCKMRFLGVQRQTKFSTFLECLFEVY